jgi:hypothetical protein
MSPMTLPSQPRNPASHLAMSIECIVLPRVQMHAEPGRSSALQQECASVGLLPLRSARLAGLDVSQRYAAVCLVGYHAFHVTPLMGRT